MPRYETKYCPACDQNTAEWESNSTDQPCCTDCESALYESYNRYVEAIIDCLNTQHGMSETEVNDFLFDHGNPTKAQAEAIINRHPV